MWRIPVLFALMLAALATPHATAAETLSIKGSNTFGEELGPLLIQKFKTIEPGTAVSIESHGSGSGIAALLEGGCDVATASRPATEDESRLAKSRGVQLKSYVIGYYGVAVIVNSANPVRRLTDRQVADLFSGAIENWSAAGGVSANVKVFTRRKTAGAYLGFQELALNKRAYARVAQELNSDQEIAQAVAKDPHAIGYVSFAHLDKPGIHAVTINLSVPTRWEVNQNTYPYARALRFYTNSKSESRATKRFIDFVRSKAGQQAIGDVGFVGFAEPQMLPTMEP